MKSHSVCNHSLARLIEIFVIYWKCWCIFRLSLLWGSIGWVPWRGGNTFAVVEIPVWENQKDECHRHLLQHHVLWLVCCMLRIMYVEGTNNGKSPPRWRIRNIMKFCIFLSISVDFMKQLPEGLVCFFTIKNPSFPDYISKKWSNESFCIFQIRLQPSNSISCSFRVHSHNWERRYVLRYSSKISIFIGDRWDLSQWICCSSAGCCILNLDASGTWTTNVAANALAMKTIALISRCLQIQNAAPPSKILNLNQKRLKMWKWWVWILNRYVRWKCGRLQSRNRSIASNVFITWIGWQTFQYCVGSEMGSRHARWRAQLLFHLSRWNGL